LTLLIFNKKEKDKTHTHTHTHTHNQGGQKDKEGDGQWCPFLFQVTLQCRNTTVQFLFYNNYSKKGILNINWNKINSFNKILIL
jgi:hypothetical protein